MLLNYKFENFMSFRNEAEFSMLASGTKVKKRFPDNYRETKGNYDVLKTAVIVGENAGGKSNFVRSLEYFQLFFKHNERVRSYKNTVHSSNSLVQCAKKCNSCQTFEIEVISENGCIYLYHLEIDAWGIKREILSYKNKRSEKYKLVMGADREVCDIHCEEDESVCKEETCCTDVEVRYSIEVPDTDTSMEKTLGKAMEKQLGIGLHVMKLAILGNEHAVAFSEWMKETLSPETYSVNAGLYKAIKGEEEDLRILKDARFMDIFKMVDGSISDIEIDEEKTFTKTRVVRQNQDGMKFKRELMSESSGVSEFFAWALQIFKVVYENKVVFADEMDRVLNPVLSDRVISFINGKKHTGQFIFTTHNVLHLDLKNYMKEQIYFITKDIESLESELYSLADFPEIRYETTKIYEFYLKGILGGTVSE